jgi:hypothetical protein
MAALLTFAAIWLLLRSALLLHQASRHSDEARLARGFLTELRRRGLMGSHPLNPGD